MIIAGAGHFLPEKEVFNHDLEKVINTTSSFIEERTGVLTRRHVEHHLGVKDLMIPAVKAALSNAGITASEVDLLIVNTISPDHHDPSQACLLQPLLQLGNIPVFDIRAQCSGFIYGMQIAQQFLKSETCSNILVVCGEVLSKRMDYSDNGRNLAILLGDGAGAFVFKPGSNQSRGVIDIITHADGSYFKLLWTEAPGSSNKKFNDREGCYEFRMTGKNMFEHAVKCLSSVSEEILEKNNLTLDDIDIVIPHQPNMRILDAVAANLNIPENKMIRNVDKFGNMASASLPVAISIALENNQIKQGDLALFVTYGSGATWGACIYQF